MGMNVEAFVDAVLSGKKYSEVAKAAGISYSTVQRKLGDTGIQQLIADKRRERRAAMSYRLGGAREAAIETLIELSKSGVDAVRLRAAAKIIDVGNLMEDRGELEAQVRALEELPDAVG